MSTLVAFAPVEPEMFAASQDPLKVTEILVAGQLSLTRDEAPSPAPATRPPYEMRRSSAYTVWTWFAGQEAGSQATTAQPASSNTRGKPMPQLQ